MKGTVENMSDLSKKKILSKKRLQMEARKKALQQKESQKAEKKTLVIAGSPCRTDWTRNPVNNAQNLGDCGSKDVTTEENTPVIASSDAAITSEAIPTIAENASSDDIERLLKKIKMEITFSDDSTINREIVISSNEMNNNQRVIPDAIPKAVKEAKPWEEQKTTSSPEETKIPWVTVAVLAFIVCASLITGIFHWYNAYYLPVDPVEPGHVAATPERTPEVPVAQAKDDEPASLPQDPEPDPDSDQPSVSRQHAIDPLPEFLLLWEEHDNEDIVAILFLGETEIPVTQSNDNAFYITHDINGNLSPLGWVFLDYQVDLYIGMEHNMVIFDPVGEFLRPVMQDFAEYDFFLRNPMITLSTLFGEFEWEIFSYYIAPSDFPFAIVDHPDDDIWGEIVEQFSMASLYNTMLDVNMYDQVLTIVVPTTVNPELFYILQARMLRQITS
jgi:hypothetical protein